MKNPHQTTSHKESVCDSEHHDFRLKWVGICYTCGKRDDYNEIPEDWQMFKVFARLHPVEAYESRPEDFRKFMREEGYDFTDEQIKEIIVRSKNS